MIDRKFVREGLESGAFVRDERNLDLAHRVSVTNVLLNTRAIEINQVKCSEGCAAHEKVAATMRAFKEFATDGFGAPESNVKPKFDKKMFKDITEHMHAIGSDSASNEMKSGEIHRGGLQNGYNTDFPNLLVILRDKLHGARRLTGRLFSADPYMSSVLEKYVRGKRSIAIAIEKSLELKEVYARYVTKCQDSCGITVRNLSQRKHRADSLQKPLGRFILTHDAMRLTAKWITCNRVGTVDAEVAAAFLKDFGPEEHLQLGMMADAGDETIQLVRFCDVEGLDLAKAPEECRLLDERITYLFDGKRCLETMGYTKLALEGIKRIMTCQLKGCIISIGTAQGASQEIVDRCLARMCCWTKLSRATLQAEFPSWELLQSFRVYSTFSDLGDDGRLCIKRIATAFGVDERDLECQLADYKPMVKFEVDQGHSPKVAYRIVLQRVMETKRIQDRHPYHALKPGYVAWATWLPSTALVEQHFGHMFDKIKTQQMHWEHAAHNAQRKIILDRRKDEENLVVQNARECWARYYGMHREHVRRRLDTGVKREKKKFQDSAQKNTEISWIRERRIRVASEAAISKAAPLDLDECEQWGESHDHELNFQQDKTKKRKFQALREGILALEDVDDELVNDAKEQHKRDLAAETQYDKDRQRKKARSVAGSYISFDGKKAWVDKSSFSKPLARALQEQLITRVDKRSEARYTREYQFRWVGQ